MRIGKKESNKLICFERKKMTKSSNVRFRQINFLFCLYSEHRRAELALECKNGCKLRSDLGQIILGAGAAEGVFPCSYPRPCVRGLQGAAGSAGQGLCFDGLSVQALAA